MSTVIKANWSCRPATSHLLGQRWHFVGSIVRWTNVEKCRWFNVSLQICPALLPIVGSTSPANANVMPTSLYQTKC